ncbi:putative deoxyribonuclease TATDN1-like protein [Leptotrombidium deliense]|uniref:Deoxyribonuclease TATDN1 n=1 Tax=Leptotrombidium deliense TaxID=299467 RepID=A0A443SCT9_9ACAR|nr:putative deoxyribonuclease TATDN1-like protein [Leptotrombidium deliense]
MNLTCIDGNTVIYFKQANKVAERKVYVFEMAKIARRMIDIGANLTDPMFRGIYNGSKKHESDLTHVLERAFRSGVEKIIITSGCLQDITESLELANTNDNLFTTVGCHPTRCLEFESDGVKSADDYLDKLLQAYASNKQKIVAVGEFGLDYDRLHFCPKDVQLKSELIICIHIHSFDGTVDEAKQFLDLGLYIGINGCSLKTESNLQVIKEIPSDRLMIETDSPWCELKQSHASFSFIKTRFESKKKEKFESGFQVKGRNEPCNLVQILEVLSAVRDENIEELEHCIYNNTVNLFFDRKV